MIANYNRPSFESTDTWQWLNAASRSGKPLSEFIESTLATSEIFNGLTEMTGTDQKEKAVKLIKSAKQLSVNDIEGAYIQVKQYPSTLSRAAIKAFDENKTVLIYNDVKSLSVTVALPFITFNTASGHKTYIFMDNYVKRHREGQLTIDAPILHDLLIGALISTSLKANYDRLATNAFLQKILMELYAKFVIHIFNRDFSIKADRIVFETLQYWVNRFFLTRIFGSQDTPENIELLSKKDLKYLDEMRIAEVKRIYDEADPAKLSEMLELCKKASPRMKTLAMGTFISSWINYYFPISMMAPDNVEYLIFMIICLLNGNNLVSIAAGDIVKEAKNIKSLREELLKLI